jgi:hypothetical protein
MILFSTCRKEEDNISIMKSKILSPLIIVFTSTVLISKAQNWENIEGLP